MTDTPTTASLDALEALLAKATPGEWNARGWGDGSTEMGMTNVFNDDAEVLLMECIPEADAALIAALRNAAPDLIAKARRVEELEAALRDIHRAAEASLAASLLMGLSSILSSTFRFIKDRAALGEQP